MYSSLILCILTVFCVIAIPPLHTFVSLLLPPSFHLHSVLVFDNGHEQARKTPGSTPSTPPPKSPVPSSPGRTTATSTLSAPRFARLRETQTICRLNIIWMGNCRRRMWGRGSTALRCICAFTSFLVFASLFLFASSRASRRARGSTDSLYDFLAICLGRIGFGLVGSSICRCVAFAAHQL